MRLCPLCLGSNGIRRDFWSLAHVVACPVHGCLLVDACSACSKRFGAAPFSSPVACGCGRRFDHPAVKTAPLPAIRAARNLALIVGANASTGASAVGWALELATPFTRISANDYMSYMEVIGTAATTSAKEDVRVEGLARRYALGAKVKQPPLTAALARIEAAAVIMDDWPGALHALLKNLRERGGATQSSDLAAALPTVAGRSLLRPRRGSNGLPLRLIYEAVDGYWRLHGPAECRKRNLTVENAAALKMHSFLNATTLAAAVGSRRATGLHSRILRRVLDEVSPENLTLPPGDTADLLLRHCVGRHRAVVDTMTGHAAVRILEGRSSNTTLSGWNHPNLVPVDPALQGLRLKHSALYSTASVHSALARMRAASRRPDEEHRLSALVSVAMKLAPLRPWYGKTALLLDLLDGTVPVFATVEDVRLDDLLVDLAALKTHIASRDPALRSEYLALAKLNEFLLIKLGPGSSMGLEETRRLVRAGAVGIVLIKSTAANRTRPVVQRLYRVVDMTAVVERRLAHAALPEVECKAAGRQCDVAELMIKLREDGSTLRATAKALSRSKIRTINGAAWTHSSVGSALRRADIGQSVNAFADA